MDEEHIEIIGCIVIVWLLMLLAEREIQNILQVSRSDVGVVSAVSGIMDRLNCCAGVALMSIMAFWMQNVLAHGKNSVSVQHHCRI